jgi:hypothetical protein
VPETPSFEVTGTARTFLTRRSDRRPGGRRLCASALTLTGRVDTPGADSIDIAQALTANVAPAHVRLKGDRYRLRDKREEVLTGPRSADLLRFRPAIPARDWTGVDKSRPIRPVTSGSLR